MFLFASLAACAGKVETVTEPAPLVPYRTVSPSATPTIPPPLYQLLLPTPTTVTYTIVLGDTLSGIAGHFGLKPEALLAANPGLQGSALSVGVSLIIPSAGGIPTLPVPTPARLPVQQAHCWPEANGGLWCFALVKNEYTETLENLSALFTLLDSSGQELSSQASYALLNALPSGQFMPLTVHFPPPEQAYVGVRLQVLSAIRLIPGDARYLPVTTANTLVSIEASGRSARVTGQVLITGAGEAGTLWLLATAYDAAGNVVGLRRWESPSMLSADAPVSFDFFVYSLGPKIDRVEFLPEARP
jgi:LysM repeat protein